MTTKKPFEKLKRCLEKVKSAFEARKATPVGISQAEIESLTNTAEIVANILQDKKSSIAFSDLTMEDVCFYFGVHKHPTPMVFPSWGIEIPEELIRDLESLSSQTEGSSENEALARMRIDKILVAVLEERKKWRIQGAQSMRLGTDTFFLTEFPGESVKIRGEADYTIWYNSHSRQENQLIVVEAKKARHVFGLPQLLGYMGAVQIARKRAGRPSVGLHGVLTDGYQWDFVRLHPDGKYSIITYRWDSGQFQQIWDILNWMVASAEVQSPRASDNT